MEELDQYGKRTSLYGKDTGSLSNILVGCGQITWIRFTSNGAEWLASEEQVLSEIAQAGYDGAPASPERDRSAQETSELYARHGLRPAPGYIGPAFWNKERRAEILQLTGEHLLLVAISTALAVFVGVPLGLALARRPRLARSPQVY